MTKTAWTFSTNDPNRGLDAYVPDLGVGQIVDANGQITKRYYSGRYSNGVIVEKLADPAQVLPPATQYSQTLDLKTGQLTTEIGGKQSVVLGKVAGYPSWRQFWQDSDIEIDGDADAQEATRAELFYLAGSASPTASIPPFGLSSNGYKGHIFWDAETWMLPALIAQHPQLARGIVMYRYQRLAQAKANAELDHFPGAEYPWESAESGAEEAPAEFAQEKHITADVAIAAWQYYLWIGDKTYLKNQGWPVLQACANYWAGRVSKSADGSYHVLKVIGPDETSELVDDDAWTNAAAAQCLRDANLAAAALKLRLNKNWSLIASRLVLPRDPRTGAIIEYAGANDRLRAKQADTQLILYPLSLPLSSAESASILAYAQRHTITVGPAMTSSINALIAARLGRAQESLELFHKAYRPFLRDPWNAFSEKKSRNNAYFCTGMGGCLQTVLYGFAGLNIATNSLPGRGKLVAASGDASLYADPHLPPGWAKLVLRGIKFRGREFDLAISKADTLSISPRHPA